jgi:hypothetical protein
MAQRTPRTARGPQPARAAAKSRKVTTTDVEVVEESSGLGVDAGIAIFTTILLIAAIVLVDMMQAKNGNGFLFS